MANSRNLCRYHGSAKKNKRAAEEARRLKDAKRKKEDRLGEAIVEWEDKIAELETALEPYRHPRGKARTQEQIVMSMQTALHLMQEARHDAEEDDQPGYLNLNTVDNTTASIHGMKYQHVKDIRKTLAEENELIIACGDVKKRGAGSEACPSQLALNYEKQQQLVEYVDDQHLLGMTVTNKKLRHEIFTRFDVEISRSCCQKYLHRLGLTWHPTKPKAKTFKAYRSDAIGSYIIGYSLVKRRAAAGEVVLVYTDESYIHQGHQRKESYFRKGGGEFNKKSGKGPRLIILHAITEHGPLCEYEDDKPIDDLAWTGNTPHPELRADGKRTAECLWMSTSSSGDYHDNMNSEMFMKWVEQRLVPTFEKQHPGKKMVLVADNAPYHHKRAIGSLNALSKKALIELAKEHSVSYLELPWTPTCQSAMEEDDDDKYYYVQDRGEFVSIDTQGQWEMIGATASRARPFCPTKQELQLAAVAWMKAEKPHLLDCQVEQYLQQRGHEVLWTPPCCAQLQPIELFWAAGKNYAADHCWNGRSMKETVQLLREGWYGNEDLWQDGNAYIGDGVLKRRKSTPVNCSGLVRTAEKFLNDKFIPIAGFTGTVDNLCGAETFQPTVEDMPIDMIINLTMAEEDDD